MPANKGAEPKQTLIIFLVCFILLSVILGVTTYYGYAEQEHANEMAAAQLSFTHSGIAELVPHGQPFLGGHHDVVVAKHGELLGDEGLIQF